MTFAEFMELALYHPDPGYYARAAQRSGRAGDFFTSVDVGPVFGELLASNWPRCGACCGASGARRRVLRRRCGARTVVRSGRGRRRQRPALPRHPRRLGRDGAGLLRGPPTAPGRASPAARAAQRHTLGPHATRSWHRPAELPPASEAPSSPTSCSTRCPRTSVIMTGTGLREVQSTRRGTACRTRLAASRRRKSPAYLDGRGSGSAPGMAGRGEPRRRRWNADRGPGLRPGIPRLIDYGHEAARPVLGGVRATLTTFAATRRRCHASRAGVGAAWLADPGECDITAHVDLTPR